MPSLGPYRGGSVRLLSASPLPGGVSVTGNGSGLPTGRPEWLRWGRPQSACQAASEFGTGVKAARP